MGSVTTRDEELHQRLKATSHAHGVGRRRQRCRAGAALACSRSQLRYEAQDRAGRTLAQWWRERPEMSAGAAPGLARLARSRALGTASAAAPPACSRWSSTSATRWTACDAFVDALRLFRIGYSWAGAVSLVVPYDLAMIRAKPAWRGTLVRFSVGLEAVGDLIDDCLQALCALDTR